MSASSPSTCWWSSPWSAAPASSTSSCCGVVSFAVLSHPSFKTWRIREEGGGRGAIRRRTGGGGGGARSRDQEKKAASGRGRVVPTATRGGRTLATEKRTIYPGHGRSCNLAVFLAISCNVCFRGGSAMRLYKCWFCSCTIYPGHGIQFVHNDAKGRCSTVLIWSDDAGTPLRVQGQQRGVQDLPDAVPSARAVTSSSTTDLAR